MPRINTISLKFTIAMMLVLSRVFLEVETSPNKTKSLKLILEILFYQQSKTIVNWDLWEVFVALMETDNQFYLKTVLVEAKLILNRQLYLQHFNQNTHKNATWLLKKIYVQLIL